MQVPFLATLDERLQHTPPLVCAVNVAREQGAAFEVAELIELEQPMAAPAFQVADFAPNLQIEYFVPS
jgi:hypothetical protein